MCVCVCNSVCSIKLLRINDFKIFFFLTFDNIGKHVKQKRMVPDWNNLSFQKVHEYELRGIFRLLKKRFLRIQLLSKLIAFCSPQNLKYIHFSIRFQCKKDQMTMSTGGVDFYHFVVTIPDIHYTPQLDLPNIRITITIFSIHFTGLSSYYSEFKRYK